MLNQIAKGHGTSSTTLSTSTAEITFREIIKIGWIDGPKVTFPVGASAGFDKTLVQAQVVSDTVSPSLSSFVSEVGLRVQYELIDIAEYEAFVFGGEDCVGDETYVGMVWFTI